MNVKLSTVDAFKNLKLDSGEYVHLSGEQLRRFQLVLLGIADDIIDVCEENQIVYQLGGGSALGAVRHQGFIPWDDDMDINILGCQREAFEEAFSKKYGKKYWIHTYRTPNYGMDMSRIRLKGSIAKSREDEGNQECGFYVDIFYIENTYDNAILRNVHGAFCMFFGLMLSCRSFYKNRTLMRSIAINNPELRSVFRVKIGIGWMISFASVRRWAMMTHWCYTLCKNTKSKYISVPSGRKHYFGEMYLRSEMVDTVPVLFEGRRWRVAKNYVAYLTNLYGNDFMVPLPPEEQETHVLLELKFPDEA